MSGEAVWSGRLTLIAGAIAMGACGGGARAAPDAGPLDDAATLVDAAIPIDAVPADAYTPPGGTVQVSSTGDDANDGVVKPVRTLRRALAIAAMYTEIRSIAVGAARYSASAGEAFPYTIPRGVTVTGPVEGGAVLIGNKAGSALIIDVGIVQNLELEDFAVAIVARGVSALDDVHVRTSSVAVRADTAARLMVTKLDVIGAIGACATGIELVGDAIVNANGMVGEALGTALRVRDRGTASLANASITSPRACLTSIIDIASTSPFALIDSTLDGAANGVALTGGISPLPATLTNVTIRHASNAAIGGGNTIAHITGGEISSGSTGIHTGGGSWTLTDVVMANNSGAGVYVSPGFANEPVTLTMRGCTIRGSRDGVVVLDFSTTDLGTTASPGNNVFQDNFRAGLAVIGQAGETQVDAVGNTWQPKRQGADAAGRFAPVTVFGPVDSLLGNNYRISSPRWSVKL
jgi:hypothetical protein